MRLDPTSKLGALIGGALVFAMWLISGGIIIWLAPEPEQRGTLGDMFGAINALFSGWAFLGVVIAILLQKQELEEQRKELRFSREAHEQSAASLAVQVKLQQTQARVEALLRGVKIVEQQISMLGTLRSDQDRRRARILDERKAKLEDLLLEELEELTRTKEEDTGS